MDKSLVAYTSLGVLAAGFLAGAFWREDKNVSTLDFHVGMHAESRPANAAAAVPAGDTASLVWASPPVVRTADFKPAEPRAGCFDIPVIRGAEVVGLGAYEGIEEPSISFADEDHEVGRITVQADPGGNPVLLVLSAYDPVVWDLNGFPPHRLRGVLIYGYSAQGLVNLPRDVPVRFATRSQGAGPCG